MGCPRDSRGGVSIEYALLGAFLGIALLAALVSTRSSLNSNNTRIATALYTAMVPTPGWTSSTLVGTQATTLGPYAATRQIYKNNDGTTRYVDTINDPAAAASYVYPSQDTTVDANGKILFQSIPVSRGDYGTAAPVVNSNYVYTGANTYTYLETSVDPNAYAWSTHKDSVVNGNLTSQLVYNKDGGVYQTNFGLDASGVNRLMNVVNFNSAGGVASTTTYTYDSAGNVASTTTK
jgi:Flp pilus assembly pilin Flp